MNRLSFSKWHLVSLLCIQAFLAPFFAKCESLDACTLSGTPLKVALVLQYYVDKSPIRQAELEYALCMNILNENIDEVHLVQNTKNLLDIPALKATCANWSVSPDLIDDKVHQYRGDDISKGRLKLGQAFEYAAKYLQNYIVLVSNSDIYFDDSLSRLKTDDHAKYDLIAKNALYYLSRYETDETVAVGTQCSSRYQGSHDTMVFYCEKNSLILTKLAEKVMVDLGTWGIESFVFLEASALNIPLKNPCYDIRSWHMHTSGLKNDKMPNLINRIAKYVYPSTLSEPLDKYLSGVIPPGRTGSYWSNRDIEVVKINGRDAPKPPQSPKPDRYDQGPVNSPVRIIPYFVPVIRIIKTFFNSEPVHQFQSRSIKMILDAGQALARLFHRRLALVSQYYHDDNPERNKELRFALCSNMKNAAIDEIYLLQSGKEAGSLREGDLNFICEPEWQVDDRARRKVVIVEDASYPERIRFSDLFEFSQNHLRGIFAMITNADIYFDDTLMEIKTNRQVFDDLVFRRGHYFLSRYELDESYHVGTQCSANYEGSHDTWIYAPGPDYDALIEKVPFELGSWGIENRVLFEARALGFSGKNPCYTIRSWHSHKSQIKNKLMPHVNEGKNVYVMPSQLTDAFPPLVHTPRIPSRFHFVNGEHFRRD